MSFTVDTATVTTAVNPFGTSITIDFPSDIANGDTAVLMVQACYGNAAGIVPSNWNARVNNGPDVNSQLLMILDKVYDSGTDGASVTVNVTINSVMTAAMVRVTATGTIVFDKASTPAVADAETITTNTISGLASSTDLAIAVLAEGLNNAITIDAALTEIVITRPDNSVAAGYEILSSNSAPGYTFTIVTSSQPLQAATVTYHEAPSFNPAWAANSIFGQAFS